MYVEEQWQGVSCDCRRFGDIIEIGICSGGTISVASVYENVKYEMVRGIRGISRNGLN